jgi:hypothetical protein
LALSVDKLQIAAPTAPTPAPAPLKREHSGEATVAEKRARPASETRLVGIVKQQDAGENKAEVTLFDQEDLPGSLAYWPEVRKRTGNAEFFVEATDGQKFVLANIVYHSLLRSFSQPPYVQGVFADDGDGSVTFVPCWGKRDAGESFLDDPKADVISHPKFDVGKAVTFEVVHKDKIATVNPSDTFETHFYQLQDDDISVKPPPFSRKSVPADGDEVFRRCYPVEMQAFEGVAVCVELQRDGAAGGRAKNEGSSAFHETL